MWVISNNNNNNNGSNKIGIAALLVFLVVIVSQFQHNTVQGAIIITRKEEQCLEKTGEIFVGAGHEDLLTARNEFSAAMDMAMTSQQKMSASYPQDKLTEYGAYCTKYGGKLHTIKIDFFDCTLRGSSEDIEVTLKNFANCMADVEECEGFGQEHLLQEAWNELGLVCELEEEETKKDPPNKKYLDDDDADDDEDDEYYADDDLAKKEKEAAAEGADEVDKEEKNSEYVPKEEMDKNGNPKNKKKSKSSSHFMKFVLFVSVCGAGYFVFDRRRRGLPIQLPFLGGGGGYTSRFQGGQPQTGFVSNYNLLSGEENELQLSSNLA